jgi:hypothetical protein
MLVPEALARLASLAFLDDVERCVLDRVRAHAHLALVAVLELPLAVAVAADARALGDDATAVMAQIVRDEHKHAELLGDAAAALLRELGQAGHMIAPPAIAPEPLARALALLHLDATTTVHHLECQAEAGQLDPWFQGVIRLHWIEEVQHALVGEQVVRALARQRSRAERDAAVDAYLDGVASFAESLARQVDLDLAALEHITGRRLGARERERVVAVQRAAYRATFLGTALAHPALQAAVVELSPSRRARLVAFASAYL